MIAPVPRLMRPRDDGHGLTSAERAQIIALSPVMGWTARRLHCAEETLAELLSPYGRVMVATVARIRARLKEIEDK